MTRRPMTSAMRRLSWIAALCVLCLGVGTAGLGPAGAAVSSTPNEHPFNGLRAVGALFPKGSATHVCSASVVASRSGDLLLTAAHCFSGATSGWTFVPDYNEGRAPYGSWSVTGVYPSKAWRSATSPAGDYAVVRVASRQIDGRRRTLQSVVGANRLSRAPRAGTTVTVPAYDLGRNDRPVTCTTKVFYDGVYPGFACGGYLGGTSGAPWLVATRRGTEVVGVIGGLHQGGCTPSISYSAPFGVATERLVASANRGAPPRSGPIRPSDGCTNGF